MDEWRDILIEGGAKILLDDRIHSIRFMKVSKSRWIQEARSSSGHRGLRRLQNIVNCAWSSIQGLIRTVPAAFDGIPSKLHQPIKRLIREIVDTGFKSGLLHQGMMVYLTGKPMGDASAVAEHAWSSVSIPSIIHADIRSSTSP